MSHLHTGFYLYNEKIYFIREKAYDDMLANNDYNGRIQFYYNDHLFSKINWEHEPNIDIAVLYKIRAQQIRDKYKHVIISFSGGSDSYETLWSFLKNDIFVDEIQVVHYEKLLNRVDKNSFINDNDLAYYLEYEYAVKPMLKYVSEHSPNTKITVLDASDFLHSQIMGGKFDSIVDNSNDKETTFKLSTTKMTSGVGPNHLWQFMYSVANVKQSKDKAGVCIVRGLEKPILRLDDKNNLFFHFSDQTMMTTAAINEGLIAQTYTVEDFFWSPDMPLIPIKQAHMVKNKLETDLSFYNKFLTMKESHFNFLKTDYAIGASPAATMERIVCEIIYPNWNSNIYAASKGGTKSPEFKLLETVVGHHNGEVALKELRDYKHKKYDKIVLKEQFYRWLNSKPYFLGKVKLNHA